MTEDWLQNLQPGDRVVVDNSGKISICHVERITATQILVAGVRFRKKDGYQMGEGGDQAHLRQVTPQYEEMALRQLVRKRMQALSCYNAIEKMEIEKVRAIAQLLEEP